MIGGMNRLRSAVAIVVASALSWWSVGSAEGFQILPGAGGFVAASSQPADGVGGPWRGESHAWVGLPSSGFGDNAAIVHLPPRIAVAETDRHADAPEGSVRMAAPLPDMPERLAAWGSTLHMAFAPESSGSGQLHRRVMVIGARRGPIGGSWVAESEGQRLDVLPPLPGEGTLAGFVGSDRGPVALLRHEAAGAVTYQLLVYTGTRWRPAELPTTVMENLRVADGWPGVKGARLDLVAEPTGLGLVLVDPLRAALWTGALAERAGSADPGVAGEPVGITWNRKPFSMSTPGGGAAPVPVSGIFLVAGRYVYCARTPDGGNGDVEVWSPGETSCVRLARVGGVGPRFAATPLDQVARLAMVWQEPWAEERPAVRPAPDGKSLQSGGKTPTQERTRIAEVSVYTGEILYDGLARVTGPVSSQELRLLALALVGMMLVVLLIVMRPAAAAGAAFSLPRGLALSDPGRRITAGLIDVVIAALAASALTRIPVLDLVSLGSIIRDPGSMVGLATMLGVGFVHGTAGEWLFGRTIGKAVMGCWVGRPATVKKEDGAVEPVLAKMGLWAAVLRNLVKWALPPLAAAGVSSPERRHRGDVVAGTVVVMRADDQEKQG